MSGAASSAPTAGRKNPPPPRSLVQAWFPGVHSDVGGGYPDGELWKHPFQWIVNEAKTAGLEFNQTELDTLLGPQPAPWHTTAQHDSATLAWKLAGIIPKRRTRRNAAGEYTGQDYGFAFPRPRKLLPGELVHRSVLERWRDVPAYRPPNLNQGTITAMLARLQPGDGFLPYQT